MFEHIEYYKEIAKLSLQEARAKIQDIAHHANYDSSKIPDYTLPSALDVVPGRRVQTAMDWVRFGRPAVLKLFTEEMYGQQLPRPDSVSYQLLSQRNDALDGSAIRKEVRINMAMSNGRTHFVDLLLYAPQSALKKPVPVFIGLNFKGNHATTDETDVAITGKLNPHADDLTDGARGCQTQRWCARQLVANGYASITASYNDLFPDRPDGWSQSALALFRDDLEGLFGSHESYTAIGVWAWGLSRLLDYAESDPLIDAGRAAVHGHSRLGKTALWAGACDRRFKLVISNCSGSGGAALARRMYGEVYSCMANYFPHWFVTGFRRYMGNEETMPFDQHELIALSAPRAVSVASAEEDRWADPEGEFLSAKAAGEIYALFGSKGLPAESFPAANTCVTGDVSYHCRTGIHDQTPFDWAHYIQLGDLYLK